MGLRIFRDRFDVYDINPRLPLARPAVLVAVYSSRFLIDLVYLRSQYEILGLESICIELRRKIETVELLIKDKKQK